MKEYRIKFGTILKANALFWTCWMLLYAWVLLYQIPQVERYIFALNSSLVVTFPLFILSLLVWPLCRLVDWRRMPPLLFLLIHFALANMYAAAWLMLSYGTAYLILGNLLSVIIDAQAIAGWQYPQGILKYVMVGGLYYSLIFYREVKKRELEESRLRLSLRETEWQALKAHINPHFLFNALNSINALIATEPGSARKMLVKLSELLRRVLSENPSQTVVLEQELAFVHQYLNLEKIRLQNRLSYAEEVDPALLAYPIPAMFLQPLIENAIKHGISTTQKGGWIRLTIDKSENKLLGRVENSLPEGEKRSADDRNATGLRNLQQRLALIYGKEVQFSAAPVRDENMFRVQFQFPVNGEALG